MVKVTRNPWITSTDDEIAAAPPAPMVTPPEAIVNGPQPSVAPPISHRIVGQAHQTGALWVLGVHGGAGEATVAELDLGWTPAGHIWQAGPLLIVARTSHRGLLAAQTALREWAAGSVPGVDLIGLALIDALPGRTSKTLRDTAQVIAGGAPRTWRLPFVSEWHEGFAPKVSTSPREYRKFVDEVNQLLIGDSQDDRAT